MIQVVCGIIHHQDKIFIARRKEGKSMAAKWEFPGGKIEKDESEEDALKRELFEELGMKVEVLKKIGENNHDYPTFSIKLIAFKCNFINATFEMTDHDEFAWVNKEELVNYDLAEADVPFVTIIF